MIYVVFMLLGVAAVVTGVTIDAFTPVFMGGVVIGVASTKGGVL